MEHTGLKDLRNGDRIHITWLPPARNASRGEPSCYAGSSGEVTDLDKNGFVLKMATALLIVGTKLKYILL